MTEREWRENNAAFAYEPPEAPPEEWSPREYTELYDRVIGRRTTWVCDKCSKPFSSLRKARSHVEKKHGPSLVESAADRDSDD